MERTADARRQNTGKTKTFTYHFRLGDRSLSLSRAASNHFNAAAKMLSVYLHAQGQCIVTLRISTANRNRFRKGNTLLQLLRSTNVYSPKSNQEARKNKRKSGKKEEMDKKSHINTFKTLFKFVK